MTQAQVQETPELLYYKWVSFSSVAQHLVPLIVREWEEVSPFNKEAGASPNWRYYFDMDKQGTLRTLLVSSGDEAVGFATFVLARHPHCDLKIAYTDTFYLLPEYRRGQRGINIFREAEKKFTDEGINRFLVQAPNDKIERILGCLDFNPIETIWEKKLNGKYS